MTRTRTGLGHRCLAGIGAALALTLFTGCTPLNPVMPGVWYGIATPPAGDCPALAWRFVVDAQQHIGGTLGRIGERPFGILSGTLASDGSFSMTATADSGGRTATATGRFTSGASTLAIQGNGAGEACDGASFTLYLGGYFMRAAGGGGGGG